MYLPEKKLEMSSSILNENSYIVTYSEFDSCSQPAELQLKNADPELCPSHSQLKKINIKFIHPKTDICSY